MEIRSFIKHFLSSALIAISLLSLTYADDIKLGHPKSFVDDPEDPYLSVTVIPFGPKKENKYLIKFIGPEHPYDGQVWLYKAYRTTAKNHYLIGNDLMLFRSYSRNKPTFQAEAYIDNDGPVRLVKTRPKLPDGANGLLQQYLQAQGLIKGTSFNSASQTVHTAAQNMKTACHQNKATSIHIDKASFARQNAEYAIENGKNYLTALSDLCQPSEKHRKRISAFNTINFDLSSDPKENTITINGDQISISIAIEKPNTLIDARKFFKENL